MVIWKAFRNQAKCVNQKTRELLSEIHRSRFGLDTSFGVSHNLLSGLHWGKTYNISSSRHYLYLQTLAFGENMQFMKNRINTSLYY